MQEMKSIQVPHKTQPPKTLYSHPQDHAFSTRSQTPKKKEKKRKKKNSVHREINIFNIHSMDCMVLTAKVTKITKTGFVSLRCLARVSPSVFSFMRLRQYKGL